MAFRKIPADDTPCTGRGIGEEFRLPCGLRRYGDGGNPEKGPFHGTGHGAAVQAVAARIVAVVDARHQKIRPVVPEPVFQCHLAAVRRGAVARKDADALAVGGLFPHPEILVQRERAGAGAPPVMGREHGDARHGGQRQGHRPDARCLHAVVIGQENMHHSSISFFLVRDASWK